MEESGSSTSDVVDVVDIEEEARAGRRPPRGRHYRIRVDREQFVVDQHEVTGREVLQVAERIPVEDYVLTLRMHKGPGEVVNLDEIVDLTQPGIERFVTGRLGAEDLMVTVYAPRSPEPKTFTWARTKLVGDAAKEAAAAFGYEGGNPGLQKGDDVLPNGKTLEAAGVERGDELDLVDTGGGVC